METVNQQLFIIEKKSFIQHEIQFIYFQVSLFTKDAFYTARFLMLKHIHTEKSTATTNTLKYLYSIYILTYFTQLQTISII